MANIIKWILTGDEFNNVDTISLVDDPAIEVDWMAFNKKSEEINLKNTDLEAVSYTHLTLPTICSV